VAVIDIGSNSGRVVVYDVQADGHLPILASSRASLRLVSDLKGKALSPQAVKRTLDALDDFRAIAVGSGARRTLAVATSAVRDATNGPALLEKVRTDLGIELRILSGTEEAEAGFLGAVRGLPVEDGAQFDIGGGSMQICRFRSRRLGGAWSFPLGSLRLSDAFLSSDPPSRRQVQRLVDHVETTLRAARLERIPAGAALVGTGGTVRNLAKIDQRRREYPLARLHGYVLTRKSVREIVTLLTSRSAKRRATVPGLNDDRADSIVGGALAVLTLMRLLEAPELLVSGQGVREGLVATLVSDELPPPAMVRDASIAGFAGAFRRWDARLAERRTVIADSLFRALEGDGAPELHEMLQHGARVLDVGRSIDFFDRHEHVADIVLATDLLGFSHREIALLSAVLRGAGDAGSQVTRYAPLLDQKDREPVARAATLLALADEIGERCPEATPVKVNVQVAKEEVRITVAGLAGWQPRRIGRRFEEDFGRRLKVTRA
jgi:exopolyphosphatase/guanosine-5'-triphosphate,3'-diphosphate pyrophosphatase